MDPPSRAVFGELAGALEVAETGEEGLDVEVAEHGWVGPLVRTPRELGGEQADGAEHRAYRSPAFIEHSASAAHALAASHNQSWVMGRGRRLTGISGDWCRRR